MNDLERRKAAEELAIQTVFTIEETELTLKQCGDDVGMARHVLYMRYMTRGHKTAQTYRGERSKPHEQA